MSKRRGLKEILGQAEAKAKEYSWSEAAELYEQALGAVGKADFSKTGELREQIGYCLYRGAFQTATQAEFTNRMEKAQEAYEKAAEVYREVDQAKSLYCRALALYARSWTLIDGARKKEVLDDCGSQLKEAMTACKAAEDGLGYGKACTALLFCLWDRDLVEWNWAESSRHLEEAMKQSQNAISTLSEVGDEGELARAYVIAGLHSMRAGLWRAEKRQEFVQTALSHVEKALELSEKTGDEYLIMWSKWTAAATQFNLTGDLELSVKYGEECLQSAKKIRDNFGLGWTFAGLSVIANWMAITEEDPDKKREGHERTMRCAEDATRHLLIVCRYDFLVRSYSEYVESHFYLAQDVETDAEERRRLLGRAIEVGQKGLEYAEQAAVPGSFLHHSLSKALYSLSKMEAQVTEKRRLLEEASEHREKSIDIDKRIGSPFAYWERGVFQNYAALIKAELATIETDKGKKRELLEEAVSHMERCIELCSKWTTIFRQATLFAMFGRYYAWFGDILNQLYTLTGEKATLEKAVNVYQDTAETYQKAELPSRVAEADWHGARLYDQLGEHTKADRSFQSASENYRLAAGKIPQLKEFYMDHALYMQAWSEIEKARQRHAMKQYGLAKEHYEKAAGLHKSTDRWDYLSSNYLALALVDKAEDLSRKEQAEEAREFFEQAAKKFVEAKEAIETRLETIDIQDEKEVATKLAKASNVRRDYCLGRIVLEEAKILDRQGDHGASSRGYGAAAEKFRKVTDAMELESDRRELRPLVDLCRAWHAMTRAEAEASPDLYSEAAQLFDEAKEHGLDEKAKVLALGHSSFCKALEAGARFEATRDMTLYAAAKRHIEAAENYYLKAGFKTASGYAKATYMLFDAYMYMHQAETETDPRKKAQYYQMAEKLLQASAGSYMKAKHPEKSDQVQRLLDGVKEKRQLALSLAEVLHAPTITSTTTSFSTPTPTHEQAVGLERFEHADVQANLILRVKEVKVDEDVRLAIEVVNAGKAPALLIKVDEVIPQGFEIKEVPEMYTFEDSYINMKGKRLNPLKTEDVKIVVKPRSKGTHVIKPRILYIDETGKYKSHEPEPVTIIVKELGIGGWIKGEKR